MAPEVAAAWRVDWLDTRAVVPRSLLRLTYRPLIERLDMDFGAVDHRKSAILAREGEKQIRAAQEDRFGTLHPIQMLADREECAPLRVRDASRDRHLGVALVDLFRNTPAQFRIHTGI
jgi:hypothetical protein